METVTRLCKRVLKVVREYFSKLKTIDELNKFQIHINNTVTTGERIFVGGFQIGYDKGDYELEQGQASNSNSDNNYIEKLSQLLLFLFQCPHSCYIPLFVSHQLLKKETFCLSSAKYIPIYFYFR
jgi:hypothetical protein